MVKIELNFPSIFGGDLERYHKWNVRNAISACVDRPNEYKITLMVYRMHQETLESSGYDPKKLAEGDEELVRGIEGRVKAISN